MVPVKSTSRPAIATPYNSVTHPATSIPLGEASKLHYRSLAATAIFRLVNPVDINDHAAQPGKQAPAKQEPQQAATPSLLGKLINFLV